MTSSATMRERVLSRIQMEMMPTSGAAILTDKRISWRGRVERKGFGLIEIEMFGYFSHCVLFFSPWPGGKGEKGERVREKEIGGGGKKKSSATSFVASGLSSTFVHEKRIKSLFAKHPS